MALESSGRVVITDAAKAAEQRHNIRADSRVFFTDFPTRRRVAGLRNPAYPTAKRQMTRPSRSACCLQLLLAHNPSWMASSICTAAKAGRYLTLKFLVPARRVAWTLICHCPP